MQDRESRTLIWKELCSEIGADFLPRGTDDKSQQIVQARHGRLTINLDLDEEDVPFYMRMSPYNQGPKKFHRYRVPFNNSGGFKFKIYREAIMSKLGKLFGLQDLSIDYPEFDDTFIIQGNDRDKIMALFANEELRSLLVLERGITVNLFDVTGGFGRFLPNNAYVLEYKVIGEFIKKDRLKRQFLIIALLIDQLEKTGILVSDK